MRHPHTVRFSNLPANGNTTLGPLLWTECSALLKWPFELLKAPDFAVAHEFLEA